MKAQKFDLLHHMLELATIIVLLLVWTGSAAAVPPSNDGINSATVITTLPFSDNLDTRDATADPADGGCGESFDLATVWYTFTPGANMVVRVDTSGSDYSTGVNVYSGTPGNLSLIDCRFTSVTFSSVAGTQYFFMIAACCDDVNGGDLVFTVDAVPPLANDDIANATIVTGVPFAAGPIDTSGATAAVDDPQDCFNNGSNWYTFTPAADTFIEANTIGSEYDTTLGVYVGSPGSLSLIGCNDDFFGLQSAVRFDATANTTYYFMVGFCCGNGETGGGTLLFNVQELPPRIGSISGQVVDALTGTPLPGDIFPSASVELQRCEAFGCFGVSFQVADSAGRFQFSVDFDRRPLEVGTYQVAAFANEYVAGQTEPFEVDKGEDRDVGDVPLQPFPIQFSEIRPCGDLPPEGGHCRYSVRIANRQTGPFQGAAWSMVESGDIGSFTGFTRFQPQRPRHINVGPEESKVVHFSFEVPSTVRNGAFICAQIFVGQGAGPFFDTVGQRDLFCILKGFTGGFSVLLEEEVKRLRQQVEARVSIAPQQHGGQDHRRQLYGN